MIKQRPHLEADAAAAAAARRRLFLESTPEEEKKSSSFESNECFLTERPILAKTVPAAVDAAGVTRGAVLAANGGGGGAVDGGGTLASLAWIDRRGPALGPPPTR